jgi:hypothetical protein
MSGSLPVPQTNARHIDLGHMPPRVFLSPVSDNQVVAVFDQHVQLKAATVVRLLHLRRSRQRIIEAHLRRLSRPPLCRLVELPSPPTERQRHPLYALAQPVDEASLPLADSSANATTNKIAEESSTISISPAQGEVKEVSALEAVNQLTLAVDALRAEVAVLRSQLQQQNTPSPLQFKIIHKSFKAHLRVIFIFGDGRCLLYSLLQSTAALLPSPHEADELRHRLKNHLLSSYTTEAWDQRVPELLSEGLSPRLFADKYMSGNTTHLPPAAICLWQDLCSSSTDVFVLQRSDFELDRVEKVSCCAAMEYAVILLLTWQGSWCGAGHYELVTCNHVVRLPRGHPLLTHLDELHLDYKRRFSIQHKRKHSEWKPTGEVVLDE